MSTNTTDASGQSDVPHPRYHATKRKAYGSQRDVAEAWADGAYPTHNVMSVEGAYGVPSVARRDARETGASRAAELYSSENFRGYQFDNGAGTLVHYSTREAIRTPEGLVISNKQCWATGFASCATPRDTDGSLPLSAVEELVDDEDSVFDVVDVIEPDGFGSHGRVAVIDGESERYGIALGTDPSIINGDRSFAFRLSTGETRLAERSGGAHVIRAALTPADVRHSDLEVVDSRDFSKSRLNSDERRAHVAAGGKMRESRSRWRDRELNPQRFRADLQGRVIVRHGEWFFIPTDRDDVPPVGASYAEERLGSHYAARHGGQRSPLPDHCRACGATARVVSGPEGGREDAELHVNSDGSVTCNVCGADVPRDIYVRGEIRHRDNDHNAVNLGERWHRAVTHDRDVLVYRTGTPEARRGRRGRRGGGWD